MLPPVRRHGDKASEMTLLSLTEYGRAAEKLTKHNPLTFKRAAFVSTEDPDVIRDVHNLTTFGVNGAAEPSALFTTPARSRLGAISYQVLGADLTCNRGSRATRGQRLLRCPVSTI